MLFTMTKEIAQKVVRIADVREILKEIQIGHSDRLDV